MLKVRKGGGRNRALGTPGMKALPLDPNDCWSLDFTCEARTDGRRFSALAFVDDFTPECLALGPDALSGTRVEQEPGTVIARRRCPGTNVSDIGKEFKSTAILHRTGKTHAQWVHRELQQPLTIRCAERSAVHDADRSLRSDRPLEAGLQSRQTDSALGSIPSAAFATKIRLEMMAA